MMGLEEQKTGSIADTLRGLERSPLFWFLRNAQIDQIQHRSTNQTLILKERNQEKEITVFAETLAANPGGKLNEDSYMILPFGKGRVLFAVLDGASSQKEIRELTTCGTTGAFYISHLASSGFEDSLQYRELSQRENLTARDIMEAMNKWIFEETREVPGVDYSDVLTVPGMAATFLLMDFRRGEITIAHVADTAACVFYRDGQIEVLTRNQNERFDKETIEFIEKLAREYKCNLAQIHKISEAKAKIKAQLQESFCRKINTPGGCGVLNGMPELIRNGLIFETKIKISENFSGISLFSDGALPPYTGREISPESAVRNLIGNSQNNRGSSVLEEGVRRLDNDPNFEMIPRLKRRDDATIIEISLNKQQKTVK